MFKKHKKIKVLILLLIVIITLQGCTIKKYATMTGYYYRGKDDNANYLVNDKIVIADLENESDNVELFAELDNGDKIEIKYDYILEIFPPIISTYDLKLVKKGDLSNIPDDIVLTW